MCDSSGAAAEAAAEAAAAETLMICGNFNLNISANIATRTVKSQDFLSIAQMSAEAVSQITSMGFSDAQARQALAATRGNVEASINW